MTTKLKARQPEEVKPGHIKGVIFGKYGSGKTFLALSFPSIYFIDSESGATRAHYAERLKASNGVYLGVEDGSQDFDVIIDQIKALATEDHPYKTLVIDSITKVYNLAIAKEAERLGSKDAFGASKKPAVAQMRRLISWISKLDMNVWLIAHEVAEWGLVDGQRAEMGKTADVYDKLLYELDLTLQIRQHSAKRRDALVVKSRLSGFPSSDVIVLQDNGVDMCYDEIAARYGKDSIEAKATPIHLATSEQVERITILFEAMNLTDEQISKGLARKNAENIADLSASDAQIIIDDIQKKLSA